MGGAPQEQPEGRCAPSPLQAWRGQFCEHLLFSGLPIQDTAWPSCLGHSPGVHYCLNLQVENRGSGGNRLHLEPQAAAPTTLGRSSPFLLPLRLGPRQQPQPWTLPGKRARR